MSNYYWLVEHRQPSITIEGNPCYEVSNYTDDSPTSHIGKWHGKEFMYTQDPRLVRMILKAFEHIPCVVVEGYNSPPLTGKQMLEILSKLVDDTSMLGRAFS